MQPLGYLVGLQAEATLLRHLGVRVAVSGATRAGAEAAVASLIHDGVAGLVSFGLAAGLDPRLRAGDVLVPSRIVVDGFDRFPDLSLCARLGGVTGGALLHSDAVVALASEKRLLHERTGCVALDMESGVVAVAAHAAGLPFAALRAICDAASRDLPEAARLAMRPDGGLALRAIAGSLCREPGQIPGLLALAADAARARRTLAQTVTRLQNQGARARFSWPPA